MSSLVLLNSEGVVVRKLQLVSLPDDYIVPEKMTVSWRIDIQVSSRDPMEIYRRQEPVEAYFYLGSAWGQVCRGEAKRCQLDNHFVPMRFGSRTLTITVQATTAKDFNELRDRIMHLINSGVGWEVRNDLNPKPKIGLLHRLIGMQQ